MYSLFYSFFFSRSWIASLSLLICILFSFSPNFISLSSNVSILLWTYQLSLFPSIYVVFIFSSTHKQPVLVSLQFFFFFSPSLHTHLFKQYSIFKLEIALWYERVRVQRPQTLDPLFLSPVSCLFIYIFAHFFILDLEVDSQKGVERESLPPTPTNRGMVHSRWRACRIWKAWQESRPGGC